MKRFLAFFGIIVLIFVLSVPVFAGASSATATRGSLDGEISFLFNNNVWGDAISLSSDTQFVVKQVGNEVRVGIGSSSSFTTYQSFPFDSNITYKYSLFDDVSGEYLGQDIPILSGGTSYTSISGAGFYIVEIVTSSNVSLYSISFNSNGGSAIPTLNNRNMIPTAIQSHPDFIPTKSGFTFDGWYMDSALTTIAIGGSALSANITLYAKWTPVQSTPSTVNVTFILADIPSGAPYSSSSTYTYDYGDSASVIYDFNPNDSSFDGWYYDSGYTNKVGAVGDTTTLTADLTVYGRFVAPIIPVINRLIFDTQGGSSVSPIVCDEVPELEDLPETTRDGWIFDGWYYEASGNNLVIAGDAVVGTVTVYAHWIGVNHLHLNPNGGDFLGEYITDLSYDYVPAALPRVYRSGYKFLGWYYEDGSEVNAGDQITGTVYISAHWEQLDTTGLSYEDGYRQGQADAEAMKSIINSGWSVFYSGFNDFTHSTTIGGITIISLLATIVVLIIVFYIVKLIFKS